MTSPLPPLRDVIAQHGLNAKKSLGQHFLLDLNLTGRIARCAGNLSEGTVIEVGPGPGGLTRALLDAGAKHMIAIERDARCIAVAEEISAAYGGRLEIVEGDALDVDAHLLGDSPRRLVSNLPYNISTVLLLKWLKHIDSFTKLTLMFQTEVADRIIAAPRSKAYGRLSVMAQWLCLIEREFNIDRNAFTPPPKVMSTVLSFTPRPKPLAPAKAETLEKVTAAAFGQRRKMLRASLKALHKDSIALLEKAGVSPTARAEELSVEEFCALARAFDGD